VGERVDEARDLAERPLHARIVGDVVEELVEDLSALGLLVFFVAVDLGFVLFAQRRVALADA
jgi:hypothetical protein